MQELLLLGIFSIKEAVVPAALLVPLLVATITFGLRFRQEYARVTAVATLESLAHTDVAEWGPATWAALKEAYEPYPDTGRTTEISKDKLSFWVEPYGKVTQGVFSDGQRATVCVMNASLDEEFKETMEGTEGGEPITVRAATTDYGSMAGGETSAGGRGKDAREEAYYQGTAIEPPRREIQFQVGRFDGTEGGEEKWEHVDV